MLVCVGFLLKFSESNNPFTASTWGSKLWCTEQDCLSQRRVCECSAVGLQFLRERCCGVRCESGWVEGGVQSCSVSRLLSPAENSERQGWVEKLEESQGAEPRPARGSRAKWQSRGTTKHDLRNETQLLIKMSASESAQLSGNTWMPLTKKVCSFFLCLKFR